MSFYFSLRNINRFFKLIKIFLFKNFSKKVFRALNFLKWKFHKKLFTNSNLYANIMLKLCNYVIST